jgi:hypothetical protein
MATKKEETAGHRALEALQHLRNYGFLWLPGGTFVAPVRHEEDWSRDGSVSLWMLETNEGEKRTRHPELRCKTIEEARAAAVKLAGLPPPPPEPPLPAGPHFAELVKRIRDSELMVSEYAWQEWADRDRTSLRDRQEQLLSARRDLARLVRLHGGAP